MNYTAKQILPYALAGGFPSHSVELVAILAVALRESSGDPEVTNFNKNTGDRSYGWTQINMLDPNVAKYINENVLKGLPETALLDPTIHMKAAYALSISMPGDKAYSLAWYIDRNNTNYQTRFASHLLEATLAVMGL